MWGLGIKVRLRLGNKDCQPAAQSQPWQPLPKTLKEVMQKTVLFHKKQEEGPQPSSSPW